MVYHGFRASLVAQLVKNSLAIQETLVWSLDQEDLLEKEMATHSNIVAWWITWTEEPGGLQSMGSQRIRQHLETKPPPPPHYCFISNPSFRDALCLFYSFFLFYWLLENFSFFFFFDNFFILIFWQLNLLKTPFGWLFTILKDLLI